MFSILSLLDPYHDHESDDADENRNPDRRADQNGESNGESIRDPNHEVSDPNPDKFGYPNGYGIPNSNHTRHNF
jgi:hypothetical protein